MFNYFNKLNKQFDNLQEPFRFYLFLAIAVCLSALLLIDVFTSIVVTIVLMFVRVVYLMTDSDAEE